jgi:hypothetical protein
MRWFRSEQILDVQYNTTLTLASQSASDYVCRVIDAFVEMLVMSELGFDRIQQPDLPQN